MPNGTRRDLAASLETSFEMESRGVFVGFAVDMDDPSKRFTIELLIDGLVVKTSYADNFLQRSELRGIGDGCYGFAFSLRAAELENATQIEARIANFDLPVGSPLQLDATRAGSSKGASASGLSWRGGLRFSGWIIQSSLSSSSPLLEALVDGEVVMQVSASGWAQPDDDIYRDQPARGFDFHLPERFADGCVRRLSVRRLGGDPLEDPLPFVAFPGGLEATLGQLAALDSERLRGVLFDRLIPMSLPMTSYQDWLTRFPSPQGHAGSVSCAIVLVGTGSIDATLASLETQSNDAWTACSVERDDHFAGLDVEAIQSFIAEEAPESEYVVFALAGTVFEAHALARFAEAFAGHLEAGAAYSDLTVQTTDGSLWPIAFPAFDYERQLEQGYGAHFFALRRHIAEQLLEVSPSNLYRLFNGLLDHGTVDAADIVHIPGALATLPQIDPAAASVALAKATSAHLRERQIEASVNAAPSAGLFPAVRVRRALPSGRTTVVIPTRDRLELLRDCLQSIEPAVAQADADILIVDNDSSDPATCQFLTEMEGRSHVTVLRVEGPFNYSRLNNLAVETVDTEFLCLLNNDIKAQDADWLQEMLSRCELDVGAVGALLVWPSSLVQHGGVVLGPGFSAAHAFNDRMVGDPGYADMLRVAHQCSAVTAACLVTRTRDYLAVGGMDEVRLPVSFNDVDYCLKLRAASKRIIFTPHAKLIHLESASRGKDRASGAAARFDREIQTLRTHWGQVLIDDPYYNPMLSLDQVSFSALAWPPREQRPRSQRPPVRREVPDGF